MMNQNYYTDPNMMGQTPYAQNPYMQNPYNPGFYNGQPMGYGTMPQQINFQNALTEDEIKKLRSAKPASALNLNVPDDEYLRSMCTHKSPNGDPVHPLNDGTNDLYCEICGKRWNADIPTKEESAEAAQRVIDILQNDKYIGNLPTDMVREYMTMIPLLEKIPDIHEYSVNNYQRYQGNPYMTNPNEVNSLNMFGSLMGYGTYQPQYQQPYMNGQMMYQQQPYMNQPTGYQGQPYQPANPSVNPMQTTYGMNQQAPNQQFVGQAQGMMNGGQVYQNPYTQQPQQNQAMGQPMYQPVGYQGQQAQNPVATQPAQGQTAQQTPAQPQDGQTVVTTNKIDL